MLNIIYLAGLLFLVSTAPQAVFAAAPSLPLQFTNVGAHYDVLKGNIKVATMTETYTRTQGGVALTVISSSAMRMRAGLSPSNPNRQSFWP